MSGRNIIGCLGRTSMQAAEVVGIGVVEIPRLALVGTKFIGVGVEQIGKAVRKSSDAGVNRLDKLQDRMEAESERLMAQIEAWELEAMVEVVETQPEGEFACADCGRTFDSVIGLHNHERTHVDPETDAQPA